VPPHPAFFHWYGILQTLLPRLGSGSLEVCLWRVYLGPGPFLIFRSAIWPPLSNSVLPSLWYGPSPLQAQSNGSRWLWIETSETMVQNKSFISYIAYFSYFATVKKIWLTHSNCPNYRNNLHCCWFVLFSLVLHILHPHTICSHPVRSSLENWLNFLFFTLKHLPEIV
jgi:hypothetical protein